MPPLGGYATKLGLQQKDFEKGRKTLFDVVVPLREALDQECPQIDFWPLVRRMKKGKKSMEDWRKDLDMVAAQLQLKEPVTDEGLSILDEVHRVLEAEFSQDLRRLRNR